MAIPRPTYLQRQSATTELAAPQTVADTYRGAYLVAKRQEYENLLASARNELQAEWEQEATRQSIIQDQLQALDRQSTSLQRLIETTAAKIDDIDHRNLSASYMHGQREADRRLSGARNRIAAVGAVNEELGLPNSLIRSENSLTESFQNAMAPGLTPEQKLAELQTTAEVGERADDVRNINDMASEVQRVQVAGNIYRDLRGEDAALNDGIARQLGATFGVDPNLVPMSEELVEAERGFRVSQLAGGAAATGGPPAHGAGVLRQTLANRQAEMAALQDQRGELAAQIEAVGAPTEDMARQRASERYRPARSLRGQMQLGRDVRRGRRALGRFRDMSPEQQILWGGFQGARRMVGELGGMPGEGQRNEDYWAAAESIYGAMTSEAPTMNPNDMTSTALSLAQNQLGEASVQEVQAARDEILKYAMGMLMNDHEYTQPSAGTPSDALTPAAHQPTSEEIWGLWGQGNPPTEGVEPTGGDEPTGGVEPTATASTTTETAEDPYGEFGVTQEEVDADNPAWVDPEPPESQMEMSAEERRTTEADMERQDLLAELQTEHEGRTGRLGHEPPRRPDIAGERPIMAHLLAGELPQETMDPSEDITDVQPQGEFDPDAIDVPPGLPYEPYATDVQPRGPMLTTDEDIYNNLVRVVQEVDSTQPTASVGRYAGKIMAYMAGEYRPPADERVWFERVMLVAGLTEEEIRQAQLRMISPRMPPGTTYLGEDYLQNPGGS